MNKTISVLMCTYNEPETYLRNAINSILNQTYQNLQIIIVIDNPKNEQHIGICSECAQLDSRIKLLINKENMGLVKSLNKALKFATGYYVARMDADDISRLDRFEKQVNYIETHKLDLVGSNIRDMNEMGVLSKKPSNFPELHGKIKQYLRYNNAIPHPTWLGKRVVFELLDGYRDIDACEDYDFLIRLVLSGFKVGNVQEELLYYRLNSSGISSTKKAIQKTSLYIVRDYYKKGMVVPILSYKNFIISDIGKQKTNDLEKYYNLTKKLETMSEKSFLSFLYKIYIVIVSNEGKIAALNMIRERLALIL